MFGTEMNFEDFIEEYKNDNNTDKSIEIIDPVSEEIVELNESEFKEEFKEYFEEGR